MSRACYFLLLLTLIFQHFTILCAISPAPTPSPLYSPTPTPEYSPTPSPQYSPRPSSPSPSHQNNGNSPPPPPTTLPPSPLPQSAKSKGGSKGMSGGQKAGLAFGVIAGAGLVGFAGMVYAKRRKNIGRSRDIRSVQLGTAFVRRPSP